MASTAAQQENIIVNARTMNTIPVANYEHARTTLTRSHTPAGIDEARMADLIAEMEANPGNDAFDLKCLEMSARAMRRFLPRVPGLVCEGNMVRRPPRGFDYILIEGVRVSVQPDIVFSFDRKGQRHYGGVLATFASGRHAALDRTSGGYEAGAYAAFFVHLFLSLRFAPEGGVPNPHYCYAVDTFRDRTWTAPTAQVRMLRNVEAACRAIERHWQRLEIDDLA
jgi:hypothetical protein